MPLFWVYYDRFIHRSRYEQNLKVFTDEMGLSEEEKEWILGRTALKLWFGVAPKL